MSVKALAINNTSTGSHSLSALTRVTD
jgi:hypothetical protein